MNRKPRRRLTLALMLPLLVSGCYYLQAARGQLEILTAREPIAEVIDDPGTPPALRRRLELVTAARRFAVDELSLPDNDSYSAYADLGRDFVVWNVFAAPEFSVEPRRWCFPVAGCVAYRGYFSREAAERQAARLAEEGFDTHVAGVAAYSTLGRFADPVLNTMMQWSDVRLVQTLFHELAHQQLYVPDDTEFNESFATVVGRIGAQRWLRAQGREEELAALARRVEWQTAWNAEVQALQQALRRLYGSGMSVAAMRQEKRRLFAELAASPLAPAWSPANNAELVPVIAYHGLVPGFLALLEDCEDVLPCLYERAHGLSEYGNAERRSRLAAYR